MEDNAKPLEQFEIGVYRSVVHYGTLTVEAASSDAAFERASEIIDSRAEGGYSGWCHHRTELGVRYLKKDSDGRDTGDERDTGD